MLEFTSSVNAKEVTKYLAEEYPKQVKYVERVTVNNLAFIMRDNLYKEMKNTFKNPDDFYVRTAFKVKKVDNINHTMKIYLDENNFAKGTSSYKGLSHHFIGNDRALKRFEKTLIYHGYMTKNQSCIKSKYYKGKMTAGFFNMLMSYFNMHYRSGYSGNMTDETRAKKHRIKDSNYTIKEYKYKVKDKKTGKMMTVTKKKKVYKNYKTIKGTMYFIINNRTMPNTKHFKVNGIYKKSGIHGVMIEPVLVFVDKASYQQVFDIKALLDKTVKDNLEKEFKKAWDRAIKTMK